MKFRLLVIAVISALAVMLTGCDPEDVTSTGSSNEKTSGPAQVGESVKVGDGSVTVMTAEWHTEGVGEYATAPENGAYLVIDVEWVGPGSYNPLYFTFKDADGHEYNLGGLLSGYEPVLQSGELADGDKARGFVVFDVPQTAGKVSVTDQMLTAVGSWEIPG